MKKIIFALAAVFALRLTAAEIPPAEKLLPADTLAVIAVPDYAKLREIQTRSPQAKLWSDPAMKPFVEKFQAKLVTEFVGPLEKDLGIAFTNYTALLQGQFTLAWVQNGWDGGEQAPLPGWVLLLDTRDKNDQLKTNLTELKQKWTDANKPSRIEKIRDVEFTVLKLSTNDIPPTLKKLFPAKTADTAEPKPETPPTEIYLGQNGSLFLAGNQAAVLEKILIAQAGGGVATLGEQPAFEANSLALFRDAPFYGWLNAKAITDIINKRLAKDAADQPDKPTTTPFRPEKVINALGLDALKSAAFSVHVMDDGTSAEFFLTAPEPERRALLSLLAAETKETLPPAFVPADAIKFQRLRFNVEKTWGNLEKTLGGLSPQLLAGLNFAIEMAGGVAKEKNPDYDLKKSLLASLGNDLITYQKAPRGPSIAEMASPPSITLLGAAKPEQFMEALKYILTATNRKGEAPKEREFLGRKIYALELPPVRTPDGKPGPARALSIVAANGYAAFSTDDAVLEEFLRSSDATAKPLRETAGLTDAAQKVLTSRTSWFTFENQVETMRVAIAALKQNFGKDTPADKDSEGFGLTGRQELFKEWFDVSLLPEFDQIAKYFSISVSTGSATPEGISLKMFAPVPPQLKP